MKHVLLVSSVKHALSFWLGLNLRSRLLFPLCQQFFCSRCRTYQSHHQRAIMPSRLRLRLVSFGILCADTVGCIATAYAGGVFTADRNSTNKTRLESEITRDLFVGSYSQQGIGTCQRMMFTTSSSTKKVGAAISCLPSTFGGTVCPSKLKHAML